MRLAILLVGAVVAARAQGSPAACAPCHRAETSAFGASGMARALESGRDSAILQANPSLRTRIGEYSYEIDGPNLMVANGSSAARFRIEWDFGQGSAGATFLFAFDGGWFESRVSYFSALKGLDLTMGAQNITPHNLVEGAGRLVGSAEVGQCFDCHATNVVKSPRPDLSAMVAGVQCERCHGTAQMHLSGARMRKLGAMTTEEMSDFCGQCHRTWSQIASDGPHDIQNVRFQPYRLGNSKCYDAADRRIRCTTCHDPHRPLETSTAAYDSKCTACHSRAGSRRVCKVASANCASCHMPALELPGAHKKFTDHMIRIVRPGAPYPG